MGSDAKGWEDNFLQVLDKTFVKYQIVEYVTDTSRITKQTKNVIVNHQHILIKFIYS